MKRDNLIYLKKFSKLLLLAVAFFAVSCDEDEVSFPIGTIPEVSGIAPSTGLKPGDLFVISGADLDEVKIVRFGASYLLNRTEFDETSSATKIAITLPDEAPGGDLYLVSEDETVPNVLAGTLTLVEPLITAVNPMVVEPGTILELTGSDFDLVQTVIIGFVELEILSINDDFSKLSVKCPDNITGGILKVVMANGNEISFSSPVSLYEAPVLPEVGTVSDVFLGGTLSITGVNLDLVTSVEFSEEVVVEEFSVQSAFKIELTVPSEASVGEVTVRLHTANGYTDTPLFTIQSADPALYVFFNFDDKNLSWGDLGGVVTDADLAVDGTKFYEVNAAVTGDWATYFADNTAGRLNLEGVSADGYAVKMDLNVVNISAGIVLKFRLGSYWYSWQIGDQYSDGGTEGWTTVYLPLNEFKDDNGNGNPLTTAALNDASLVNEWGLNAGWNGGDIHLRIDNVGFAVNP